MRQRMTASEKDEKRECPLCMEMIDFDDLNFYPCQCRYQVCRFCWYRLINEENGLCPNCRKRYNSEEPALFKPATEEEVARRKKDRKLQEQQKKRRTADNRKHLADVRVLQKNLVFVMNLPLRLNDKETLKGNEYFGKYGKVFKVILNKNVSPNNQNQPTISAYVTYLKMEDALRAVVELNRLHIDGRHLKASLGTTKYCTQFLKGLQCTKHECMYLHEMGDDAASFTKEEMTYGKHTEYELRLIEHFQLSQANQTPADQNISPSEKSDVLKSPDTSEGSPGNRTPQLASSLASSPSPANSPAVSGAVSTPSISSQILNSAIHFPPPTTNVNSNSNGNPNQPTNNAPLSSSQSTANANANVQSVAEITTSAAFSNIENNGASLDSSSGKPSLASTADNSVSMLGFSSLTQSAAPLGASLLFSQSNDDSFKSINNRANNNSASKEDAPALDFDPVREAQEGLALEMETEGKLRSQKAIHPDFLDHQLSASSSSFWTAVGGMSGRSSSTSYMSSCSPLPPHSPAVGVSPARGGAPVNNSIFTNNPPSMSPLSSHSFDMSNLHGNLPQSPPIHSQLMGGASGLRSSMQPNNQMNLPPQRVNSFPGQQINNSMYSQQMNLPMQRQQSGLSQQNQLPYAVNNSNKSSGLNWAFVPPPSSKDPSCTIDFEATRYFSPTMQESLQSPSNNTGIGFNSSLMQQQQQQQAQNRNFSSSLFHQNGGAGSTDMYDICDSSANSYFGHSGSSTSNARLNHHHQSFNQLQNPNLRNQFNNNINSGSIHESPMSSNSIWNMGGSHHNMDNNGVSTSSASPPYVMPPSSHNFHNTMALRDSSFNNGFNSDQNNFLSASQFCGSSSNDDIAPQHLERQNYNLPGAVRPNMAVMTDSNNSNFRMFPSKF